MTGLLYLLVGLGLGCVATMGVWIWAMVRTLNDMAPRDWTGVPDSPAQRRTHGD